MSPCIFPLVGGIALIIMQIALMINIHKDENLREDPEFKYFWEKFFYTLKDALEGYHKIFRPIVAVFMVIFFYIPIIFSVIELMVCKISKKINA